jgi:signal transduction histidine kinase
MKKKNGDCIYVENNASVIYSKDIPVGLRGVIRDVTEKIQMEQNLIQAQKMETIGTLAGGIAHDFNNILTGITGTVSLLELKLQKKDIPSRDDITNALTIIKKSSERAANVVKQLLMVSREQKPFFEIIDINDVAKNVYDICYNSFDKKIQLSFSLLDENAFIMADETQMNQMLLNLCVNARDAMTIMRPKDHEQGGVLSLSIEKMKLDQNLKDKYPEAI